MARLTFLMVVGVGVCLLGADQATATATVQGFPGQNTRPYESQWAEQGRKAMERMAAANKRRAAREAEQRQKQAAANEQNAKKAASEAAAKAKAEAAAKAKAEAAAKAKAEAEKDAKRAASEAAAKAKAEAAAKKIAVAEQAVKKAASEAAAKAKPEPVPTPTPASPSSTKNEPELVYVSKDGRVHEATDIHKTVEEKISEQLEDVEKSIKELKATSEDQNRRLDDLESRQKVTEEKKEEPNAMSPQVDKIKTSLDKVKIAAGDISSKMKDSFSNIKDKLTDSFSNIKDKIKAVEKNEEQSQQKEAEKEEKEKNEEEASSKNAYKNAQTKVFSKEVTDRIQNFGRFMEALSSACDSAIKACQADKHGCNTFLSCIDVRFETSREAAVNCFDAAQCDAAADSTGNRVSTEIKDLYYNCVNKPCQNCKDEEQSMLEHAVAESSESTQADEIAKYKSYLSALSDQLMSKITGCFKCSKPAGYQGLFYVSSERTLLGALEQKPSDMHNMKNLIADTGISAAAAVTRKTTSEGQSSPKDKCAVLPTSMNGAKFGKGCGSAVWSSGSPSKQYCAGDNGRFPWWAECCEWKGTKCEAKGATKSDSAVVNAVKQKVSSMANSWTKKIKSFGFRFLEQRSRSNLRVTEECS